MTIYPKYNIFNKLFNYIMKIYQLFQLWILDKYHKNEDIPKITKNVILCKDCENTVKSYIDESLKIVKSKNQTCQKCQNILQYKLDDNTDGKYYLQCPSCKLNTQWYTYIIPLKNTLYICPICQNKLNIKWDPNRENWWYKQCSHCNTKTKSYKDRSRDMDY